MIISWYGQFCFRIQGKELNLLIDPPSKESGLKAPKGGTNVLLITNSHSYPDLARLNQAFLIEGPGEYELKGAFIRGWALEDNVPKNNATIYTIEVGDIKICHLGALKKANLSEKELEAVDEVDILMLPVGGGDSVDAEGAVKVLNQIEPKIVIPMQYKIPGVNLRLDKVDKFLKAMGQERTEILPRLVVKKKDLPQGETKVVVLKPT